MLCASQSSCLKPKDSDTPKAERLTELVAHGAVQKWGDLAAEFRADGQDPGPSPHVAMPLIVAAKPSSTPEHKRLRLINDGRFINAHCEKMPFKMEQLSDFVKQIRRGDHLGCLELALAYHHVEIRRRFRTPLGFFLDGVYYMYAVLPFGLGISAYKFCSFTDVLAAALRARPDLAGALLCYCGDLCANLGASGDRAKFLKVIRFVESSGFLINWDKTTTAPATRVETLGFIVDTVLMAYDIPNRRLANLQTTAN